jgi:hypothetical protein
MFSILVSSAGTSSAPSGCDDRADGNLILAEGETCSTFMVEPLKAISRTGETVTFAVTQTWTVYDEAEIMWIATHFVEEGVVVCDDKEESVPFDTTLTYTADCDASGFAEVSVYAHDSNFHMELDDAAPPSKYETYDAKQHCQYTKRFACGCGGGKVVGGPPDTNAPTEAPKIPFGFTDQNLTDTPVSTLSKAFRPFVLNKLYPLVFVPRETSCNTPASSVI